MVQPAALTVGVFIGPELCTAAVILLRRQTQYPAKPPENKAMSTRERWIVYPLLFLALLLILKMSYQNSMELRCRSIECYSLSVKLLNGQPVPPEGLPVLVRPRRRWKCIGRAIARRWSRSRLRKIRRRERRHHTAEAKTP